MGEIRSCPDLTSPHRADLRKLPAFQRLSPRVQALLAKALGTARGPEQLQAVLRNQRFDRMSVGDQQKVLTVFAHASRGRSLLPLLLNRDVTIGSGDPPPTVPALLSTDASGGRTLLDHLVGMTDQKLRLSLTRRRTELVDNLIRETGIPSFYVDQGAVNTCAPTTIQAQLIGQGPAEYARIVRGLSGPTRKVTLADGSTWRAARGDTGRKVVSNGRRIKDSRSVTERMFQSALMRRTLGSGFHAGRRHTGTWTVDIPDMLSSLHGREFRHVETNAYSEIHAKLHRGFGPIVTTLQWGGGQQGMHTVLVTEVRNGRVHFRNPWGSEASMGSSYADGRTYRNPTRRVEDRMGGYESMTVADFRAALDSAAL